MFRQTKTIRKLVLTIDNLLADLLIRQMLKKSQFAKLSPHQTSRYTVFFLNKLVLVYRRIIAIINAVFS